MLANPTIDTLVQRAHAIAAILGDKENQLTARQTVALMLEYDNIAAAMRAITHPHLAPAAATYAKHKDTLWAWYCHDAKLHESHNAETVAMGRAHEAVPAMHGHGGRS